MENAVAESKYRTQYGIKGPWDKPPAVVKIERVKPTEAARMGDDKWRELVDVRNHQYHTREEVDYNHLRRLRLSALKKSRVREQLREQGVDPHM